MSIARRIREAREARGRSQSSLAAAVGVTRGACGHWEKGATVPSVAHLAQVAAVLDVRFEWLATGRGERDSDPAVREERPEINTAPGPALSAEAAEVLAVLARLPSDCRSRLVAFLRSIP